MPSASNFVKKLHKYVYPFFSSCHYNGLVMFNRMLEGPFVSTFKLGPEGGCFVLRVSCIVNVIRYLTFRETEQELIQAS
jgi:hypothetical protein